MEKTMKVEAYKSYKLDNGDKVYVSKFRGSTEYWPFLAMYDKSRTGKLYIKEDGSTQSGLGDYNTPNLVEEWKEEGVTTNEMSGRVTVDITDRIDEIIREDLEWNALRMLKGGNDEYEFIGRKAKLFGAFCTVIEYYSTKKQWEEFVAKTEGKKVG